MTQLTELDQNDSDLNRELTPAKVKDRLSQIKERYCTKLKTELGVEVIFPQGTKLGDDDISGKSLEEVLNMIMGPLEHYEPPILQRELVSPREKEPTEVPSWLQGHEGLIWHGAQENPLWDVKATQYGKEIRIAYTRRQKELKPGKTETEQERTLAPIDDTFTIEEWKVVEQVINEYRKVEEDLQSPDKEIRENARIYLHSVVREENLFRKGEGAAPETITAQVRTALEQTAKTSRGFKKEAVNIEQLSQRVAEMLSQLVVLNRTRGDGKERVPKVKKNIKEDPDFEHSLSLLSNCLDTQRETNMGITLMLGEAGVGKTIAAEYFAAKTHRPYFWFPCGRGMEAGELVTHYEFDTKEGTKRFMTALAEGLQTPGAIVYVNEINALKPPVQATLHGVGDSNRALNFDGVNIPVAEGALVIIDGNPATFGSAGNIGEALLSRTRGQSMVMDYPSLRKGELLQKKNHWSDAALQQKETEDNSLRDYAASEVLSLYQELNEFTGINDQEFALLWDYFVNEDTQGSRITEIETNPKLKKLIETPPSAEHIKKILIDLRDILRIADSWRKGYEKRQRFDLIGVSRRDTIAVVREYRKTRDVRIAWLRVMDDYRKNPIEGLDTVLISLEQLIDDTLVAPSK
ncbi:MAG: AAA family ATPase [Patescibacteria group bacterium]